MPEQPRYFGVDSHLGVHPTLEVDPYFITTPVNNWSLKHFFKTHDDHTPFTDGLIIISNHKSVNRAIRSYTNAWVSCLSGETGKLRLENCRAETTTDLISDIISNKERKLAQKKLLKRLGKQTASNFFDETKKPGTTLGKRDRSRDGESSNITEGPSIKKNATCGFTDRHGS